MPYSNACMLQRIFFFLLEAAVRQSLSKQPHRDSPLQAAVQVLLSRSASEEMRHDATGPLLHALHTHTHTFLTFTVGSCMSLVTSLPVDDLSDGRDRRSERYCEWRRTLILWIISSGEHFFTHKYSVRRLTARCS